MSPRASRSLSCPLPAGTPCASLLHAPKHPPQRLSDTPGCSLKAAKPLAASSRPAPKPSRVRPSVLFSRIPKIFLLFADFRLEHSPISCFPFLFSSASGIFARLCRALTRRGQDRFRAFRTAAKVHKLCKIAHFFLTLPKKCRLPVNCAERYCVYHENRLVTFLHIIS